MPDPLVDVIAEAVGECITLAPDDEAELALRVAAAVRSRLLADDAVEAVKDRLRAMGMPHGPIPAREVLTAALYRDEDQP